MKLLTANDVITSALRRLKGKPITNVDLVENLKSCGIYLMHNTTAKELAKLKKAGKADSRRVKGKTYSEYWWIG